MVVSLLFDVLWAYGNIQGTDFLLFLQVTKVFAHGSY
jgi:hypothetical protein